MKRVLIVDDEEDLTWSIAQHLKKDSKRYKLYTVNGGQDALDILKQVPINLVVSDIRMPEISGLDLLLDIRENYPSTKVIIMTAYGSSEIQNEANERGCFKYIEKPFEIQELRNLILDGVEDRKGFEGRVSDFQISDLIQMNCLGRLTNSIFIEKGIQTGSIFIEDGNITHCETDDLEGEEAFYEIMSWEGGTFKIEKDHKSKKETIIKGWQGLLIESLRLIDEKRNAPPEEPEASWKREQELQKILDAFGQTKGIVIAELIDGAGIAMAKISKVKDDVSEISPLINSITVLEAEGKRMLNLDKMTSAVIEFDEGLIAINRLSGREEMLAVLTQKEMNLGMLRMETKKLIKKLIKVLEK